MKKLLIKLVLLWSKRDSEVLGLLMEGTGASERIQLLVRGQYALIDEKLKALEECAQLKEQLNKKERKRSSKK